MTSITNRYDFIYLFDIKDGNPNGDPDAGNLPRIDPETGQGLVTDVCLKRKVRNFVLTSNEGKNGYDIFVKEKGVLSRSIADAYTELKVDLTKPPKNKDDGQTRKTAGKGQGSEVESARTKMCDKFYDIRAFGSVLSIGANAGQVRGPIQLTFARSIDRIITLEHSITRMAVATEAEAEKQGGDNRTMGRKNTVPYGLYRAHGFISPHLAAQTGFSTDDLALFKQSLAMMFDHDRSAARGQMAPQRCIAFKHDSALGNAPAHKLFERITAQLKDENKPPRSIADYEIKVDTTNLPAGITIEEWV